MPALKQMLASFPFTILGFHSDNGSEYINRRVAQLLQKLFIEFTKSRSRHSNDNALAESKNASVVRKIFGYTHIPQKWAAEINTFNRKYLNPYINYHRPCFFPKTTTDSKGRQRKIYRYRATNAVAFAQLLVGKGRCKVVIMVAKQCQGSVFNTRSNAVVGRLAASF